MTIDKTKTVSFSGHRTLSAAGVASVMELRNELYTIISNLYNEGYTNFLNGMAIGFDMMAAEVVVEFRKSHPDVKLYAVIPFQGQELRYSHSDRLRYKRLYDSADERIYISETYTSNRDYLKRNEYLVANSSILVSYCDGRPRSGTTSTVSKASRAGLKTINLYTKLTTTATTP